MMDFEPDDVINLDDRPTTSYQRKAVHITEYRDYRVNPEPIVLEETDILLEEYLSPTRLRALTGVHNLADVKYLEMRVDTTETSLGNFGTMLPCLKQLKLNNSIIASVRDLGTSLRNLTVLWMARCGLTDLDGISSMTNLQELYLAYNELSDVSPCSMVDNLQLLDLEGNNIDDVSQVEFLALCPNLNTLTLEGNPVCLSPHPKYNSKVEGSYDYRLSVKKAVPNLIILDEEALDVVSTSLGRSNINTSTDWLIVNHAIKEGSEESLEATDSGRPGSSKGRPSTSAKRPMTSGGKPGSSHGNRPGSSAGRRPGTATTDRPDSSGSDIQVQQDDSSDLTHGSASPLCGNPVRALRSRKKNTFKTEIPYTTLPSLFAQYHHTPEHTYDTVEDDEDSGSKEDVFAELKAWRKDYEIRMKERRKASQPQVLKITHSDNSSDDDDDDNDTGIEVSPPDSVSPDSAGRIHSPPTTLTPRQAPPPRMPARPKTAGDFRMRRFKPPAAKDEGTEARHKNVSMGNDEEVLVIDREEVRSPGTPPGLILGAIDERPHSGPVIGNRKFKSDIPVDKTQPKIIDRNQPIIRTSTYTPPNLVQRFSGLARPATAKAAMQRLPNKPMKPV